MRTHNYPSDVTDEQWPLIEPHIPPEPGGGRPRETDMRDVLDAIFYILRTGCQWRYLPGDLPPKSTVWRYFDAWRNDGTLDTIHDLLRKKVRTAEKPYQPRTTASVDSQPMGKVARMFADSKYHTFKLYEWVAEHAKWGLEIIRRPEGKKGWVKLPIRWTVERTFAWLGRCRRLSKDREKSVLSSESFVKLAMIQLMLHRLEPSDVEPEFRYPRPVAA